MPRKRKPLPQALEIIYTPEFEIGVWDTIVTSRGRPAALTAENLNLRCLMIVLKDYVDDNQNWRPPGSGDYLQSGLAFQNAMLLNGIGESDGTENACLRKRVYPAIMKMVQIARAAKRNTVKP